MSDNGRGKEEGIDSSPLAAAPSMEESIKEIRQKIRERQAIAQEAYQKFVALANEESDHSKSALAELLGTIASTMESIWLDMEQLYNLYYINTEKTEQLYQFIFTLPEVTEDKEVTDRMLEKYNKLRKRIKRITNPQEEMQ
jgi:DNA repair ATPase RecN